MKKKALLLPLFFCAMFAKAQIETTNYRGAFAPAPTRPWTESWTNYDPINAAYPAPNVNVTADITSNTTWTSNNVYLLTTVIYVNSGVTLTIQPGTIIRGTLGNSSLLVARGGKLMAEGTACNPIVFTSNQAAGSRTPGSWGGVLLLGNARHNLGTNNQIEGLSAADPRNFHGGTDDNDNSGSLKYVRIEFPGFIFSTNNEINGLTMGSVGRGTTIDNVQVSYSDDDSYEWFGGSVNAKHLVAYRTKDDDFDTDNGFSGNLQYLLGVKDNTIFDASQSNGFESDNNSTGANGFNPKTSASFYNVTMIGAFRCGVTPGSVNALHRRGAHLRRNSDLKVYNSIFLNFREGLHIENLSVQNANEDSLVFRNNIIAADYTANPTHLASLDANTRAIFTNPAYGNDSLNISCAATPLLVNAYDFLNPDYRPNPAFVANPATDPTNLNAGTDLAPLIEIGGNLFSANESKDFLVDVLENGGGATNGVITVTIAKPSGWNITVPGISLTGSPLSGVNGTNSLAAYTNGDWNFSDDGANVIATSKIGIVLPKGGFVQLGFVATRKAATGNGTNQTLVASVNGGSDNSPSNNLTVQGFSAN